MPGLINAHMHSHAGLARGQGDRWTLELLLVAAPWIGGNRLLADKKLSATICAAEMALKGCTATYDLFAEFPLPTTAGMDAVAEAYADVGIRAVIAPMVADLSFYEAIPGLMAALPPPLRTAVDRLRPRRRPRLPRCDRDDPESLALERARHPRRGRPHYSAPLHRGVCLRLRPHRPGTRRAPAYPCRRKQGAGSHRHSQLRPHPAAADGCLGPGGP